MKKSAGFTLIELVIVIVILGILGAVAAPRFINMQGDAYEANVKALKGSIQSAMTLSNTKAILDGYDKGKAEDGTSVGVKELEGIKFVYGFPAATKDGIIAMLQDQSSFGEVNDDGKAISVGTDSYYVLSNYANSNSNESLTITPRAREGKECSVVYTQATGKSAPATVAVEISGC